MSRDSPLAMQELGTSRLRLEPLVVAHADAMFVVLSDVALHRDLDQSPPHSLAALRERYAKLATRRSPDGREQWLNWIVCLDDAAMGFVQATVRTDRSAWIAYLFARAHHGRGYATEATRAMIDHLVDRYDVATFRATVEATNAPSIRLLQRVGFHLADAAEAGRHRSTDSERLFVHRVGP